MLIEMALCEGLFHTAAGIAFADLLVDGHRETWPIRSKRLRGWLRRRYNTTSSIVAHFLYNFVSAAITVYARYYYNVYRLGQ